LFLILPGTEKVHLPLYFNNIFHSSFFVTKFFTAFFLSTALFAFFVKRILVKKMLENAFKIGYRSQSLYLLPSLNGCRSLRQFSSEIFWMRGQPIRAGKKSSLNDVKCILRILGYFYGFPSFRSPIQPFSSNSLKFYLKFDRNIILSYL